jgi:serine/threonine protein kinase/WD40 repeat protein
MPYTAPPTEVAHLKLRNCARGHFWESPVDANGGARDTTCPTCGAPADEMPLLDLEAADVPLPPPAPTPIPPPYQDKGGKPVVAGYEVLEDLGRTTGGVAQHRAKQTAVNRLVVLKTVLARDDPSQQAWGALRGEAAALAKLPHPNIVSIFDAGDRERQLFYNAIELVEGPNLHAMVADKPLPVPQALTLVEVLARAVHFAHEKGVVHRGLRPHAVLLHVQRADKKKTERPEPPACSVHAALCIPKITGYGLAKGRLVEGDVTDQELQDRFPCYLSPEQAWGRSKEIGPATDIYALGAILYECLTGKPPFKGSSPGTTLEQIQTIDPLPVAAVRKGAVPADVEAIVRRCLHKQPRRRYASARELADDLRRAAEGRPSQARDANFVVRFGQWSRRNPMAFVALAVGLLGLVGIIWATLTGNNKVEAERKEKLQEIAAADDARAKLKDKTAEAERLRKRIDTAEYFQQIARADALLARNQGRQAQQVLDACRHDLRNAEWYLLRQQSLGAPPRELAKLAFPVSSLAWSQDGQHLAASSAGPDGAVFGEVRAWQLADKKEWPNLSDWFKTPGRQVLPVRQVAISADGERLYWINNNGVAAWNRSDGRLINGFNASVGQASHFCCPADGKTILVTDNNGSVHSFDARSGNRLPSSPAGFQWGNVNPLARIVSLTPDGSRYAIVNPGQWETVGVFDGFQPIPLTGHTGGVTALAYHSGSGCLATGSWDGTARLWRPPFGASPGVVLQVVSAGAGHHVTAVAFTHDGKRLATCDTDGWIRIWDVETAAQVYSLNSPGQPTALAFSPKDYRLAVGQDQKVIIRGTVGE